mgnify:FL=1|jgi:hypothetical protein
MTDASVYQVVKAGTVYPITDLSREDLIVELAKAMDALEAVDEMLSQGPEIIRRWRFETPN